MLAKIQKWGNSQGIRIPKSIIEDVRIKIGESVEVSAVEDTIIIKPARKIHGRYKIKDLVEKMPKDYKTEEEDWGYPAGREVW